MYWISRSVCINEKCLWFCPIHFMCLHVFTDYLPSVIWLRNMIQSSTLLYLICQFFFHMRLKSGSFAAWIAICSLSLLVGGDARPESKTAMYMQYVVKLSTRFQRLDLDSASCACTCPTQIWKTENSHGRSYFVMLRQGSNSAARTQAYVYRLFAERG